jgi:hypothetical protein
MNATVEVPTMMNTGSSLLGEALARICLMFASYLKQVCVLTILTRHVLDNLDTERCQLSPNTIILRGIGFLKYKLCSLKLFQTTVHDVKS